MCACLLYYIVRENKTVNEKQIENSEKKERKLRITIFIIEQQKIKYALYMIKAALAFHRECVHTRFQIFSFIGFVQCTRILIVFHQSMFHGHKIHVSY